MVSTSSCQVAIQYIDYIKLSDSVQFTVTVVLTFRRLAVFIGQKFSFLYHPLREAQTREYSNPPHQVAVDENSNQQLTEFFFILIAHRPR